MSEDLQTVLRSLRDVEGVIGSFVLGRGASGDAHDMPRDLPEYFDAGALAEVGPRVERLYEAWKSFGSELETASLAFAEHKLHVRELGGGYLVVVSSAQVNAPALRMAIGMVSRRVGAALEARTSSTPPPLPKPEGRRSAAPVATPQPSPEPEPHKPRMYRGNIVK